MYFLIKIRYYFIYVVVLLSLSLVSLLSSCASDDSSSKFAYISNVSDLAKTINAEKYHKNSSHCENLKIAVLDNGTYHISEHLGKTLPNDVVYDPEDENIDTPDKHGIILLETIYALCTGSQTYNSDIAHPKLYIYNTTGLTKLDQAIDKVISEKINIVVYAQTWEFGGNLDGKGFINERINDAINSGVIWLNSIGNYRNKSFYTSIDFIDYTPSTDSRFTKFFDNMKKRPIFNKFNKHDNSRRFSKYNYNNNNNNTNSSNTYTSVRLPYDNDKLLFEVSEDNTPVNIILAWSRFTNSILEGTDTDLDLFLYDESGKNELSVSDFVQIKNENSSLPSYASSYQTPSLYPMEKISTVLNRGKYVLKVRTKTPQLFDSNDRLWFAISSTTAVSFLNINHKKDSVIFIPADNPNVISISSTDCNCESQTSRALKEAGTSSQKPEMVFPSLVKYSDGSEYIGSSTATAVAASAVALYFSSINKIPSKNEALKISKSSEFRLP